nr:MAG TPA: hypothetical protein [Caudoviricetes sp.]
MIVINHFIFTIHLQVGTSRGKSGNFRRITEYPNTHTRAKIRAENVL